MATYSDPRVYLLHFGVDFVIMAQCTSSIYPHIFAGYIGGHRTTEEVHTDLASSKVSLFSHTVNIAGHKRVHFQCSLELANIKRQPTMVTSDESQQRQRNNTTWRAANVVKVPLL